MDTTPQHFSYTPTPTRTTTAELLAASAPAVRWVIPGYVGEGLTILAGRQNSGKSWLALDWAIAVASGVPAMGAVACEQGDVLYIDLENGERRIHSRLDTFFSRGKPPRLSSLQWLNEAPPDGSFVEILNDWRRAAEAPRLVVIDAPQRVREPAGPGDDGLDGAALGELRSWATRHPVAVVCLRRTARVARVVHEVAADAIFACADAVLLLHGDTSEATLRVWGRDVAPKHMAMAFAKGRWSLLGDEIEVSISAERQNILAVLRDHGYPMNARDIAEVMGVPACNVRQLLFKMLRDAEVISPSRGLYSFAAEKRR